MENKDYQSPEVQVITFEPAAVLAASGWNDSDIPDESELVYDL